MYPCRASRCNGMKYSWLDRKHDFVFVFVLLKGCSCVVIREGLEPKASKGLKLEAQNVWSGNEGSEEKKMVIYARARQRSWSSLLGPLVDHSSCYV